jgi:hypothetical protein
VGAGFGVIVMERSFYCQEMFFEEAEETAYIYELSDTLHPIRECRFRLEGRQRGLQANKSTETGQLSSEWICMFCPSRYPW